jgi:predicted ArsR family transcriptional regulator
MARRQLSERMGISEDGKKDHMNKLKIADLIRHAGPTKAEQWEVKSVGVFGIMCPYHIRFEKRST